MYPGTFLLSRGLPFNATRMLLFPLGLTEIFYLFILELGIWVPEITKLKRAGSHVYRCINASLVFRMNDVQFVCRLSMRGKRKKKARGLGKMKML